MRRVKLDRIDRRILHDLQGSGRMTNVELARRAGISAPPCLRRVRALEKAGQSRTRAAQMLGVSRVTLYKKMKHYKLLQAKGPPVAYPFDEFNTRASNG